MKLYYETASDAIYMQETHDVEFTENFEYSYQYDAPDKDGYSSVNHGPIGRKFYVHEDSLSIFEPKIEDYVIFIESNPENRHGTYIDTFVDIKWIAENYKLKIIQREGKPFIAPEVEEVS